MFAGEVACHADHMNADVWKSRGKFVEVQGHRVFVVDSGLGDTPTIALLHGYPTSSVDYHRVWERLGRRFRVVVHDHLGFGFSDKPRDYSYSVLEQADVAAMVWRELGLDRVHIVAHDYGTSIATELLARWMRGFRPVPIESITLCNGSMHIEHARLRVVQRLLLSPLGSLTARLTNAWVFERNMRKLWNDQSTLSDDELAVMWELLTRDGGRSVLPQITHYLNDRRKFWHRWIGALQNSPLPLSFVWGTEDPVVGREVALLHHGESPGSELRLLEGVGHYPMLEAPDRWVDAVFDVLDTHSTACDRLTHAQVSTRSPS
jgi:pimeloyl-ACP methyl ester carboxylesterase